MKRVFLLLAIFTIGYSYVGRAQLILPNGNFESWSLYTPVPPASPFYEPDGGFFKTLNILDTIPLRPGITAYRCDTAFAGSYSARCLTQKIFLMDILIPGVIGTLKLNWANLSAILGTTYNWTTKPERFQGYYQSYPVNGDSSAAILLLSKWNSGTLKRDTIAYNRIVFHGVVNTWTKFDEAVQYWNTSAMPDSITLLLLSCAGYNAKVMTGSVGQVGSQALFDDVTLTGVPPYAVESLMTPSLELAITPNPASDYINVKNEKAVKNGIFEVYDNQGRKVSGFQMEDITARFNVSRLSPGVYHYRLSDSQNTVASGSFIISRN